MMNYNIILYDTSMKKLAYLENAYDISYDLTLNELWGCAFKLPAEDKKNIFCEPFNYVELFDGKERVELFRILPTVKTKESLSYISYTCEHVLATLIDDVMFQYHQIGNLGVYTDRVIRYVLDNQTTQRWQLVECDFRRQFEYKWENENLLAALFSIPEPFKEKYRWTFDTTTYPWGLSLKEIKSDYVADIQYKKNMQSITKTVDPTNLITRLYLLGYGEGDNQLTVESVNNGLPYIEKNVSTYGLKNKILTDRRFESPETLLEYGKSILEESSVPYVSYSVNSVDLSIKDKSLYPRFLPGENVLIRDKEDGLNHIFPIVSVKKSNLRGNPFDVNLEIANKSEDVTGSISGLQERTRINETYAQGATNLLQITHVDNTDSQYPLEIKFYVPQEAVRINKLILNYTFEEFRSYSRGSKSGGGETTTTGSGGGTYTSTGGGGGKYITTKDNKTLQDTMAKVYLQSADGIDYSKWIEIYRVLEHEHGANLEDHTHSVSIDPHSHSIKIDDHEHEQIHGIYIGGVADSAYLKVDGTTVVNTEEEIDLIPYLSKDNGGKIQRGTWHTVEIFPNRLTRINASIFLQLFTNSRGRGDF